MQPCPNQFLRGKNSHGHCTFGRVGNSMNPSPETPFTRDTLGNFVCNTFVEAVQSGPFDVIIIGGGAFGLSEIMNIGYARIDPGAEPRLANAGPQERGL